MALIDMTVVEQRYRAVLAVQAGRSVTEVAASVGVSRQTVHSWLARYRVEGLGGLVDRSHRPASSPRRAGAAVETAVCELRRHHPRWGPRRIRHELGVNGCPGPVPSRMTVHRILIRHGLIDPTTRKRRRDSCRRWQRDTPMQLWQMDIVGGLMLADGSECKVVTGVDDHSRYCVIAAVVPRATGRAVCLAFAAALGRFGVPEEVLTDNGKQFTDRFGAGGEVLFDRICRDNGIVHRLTQPASPTTTGKVERFHQTLRRELLNDHGPFPDLPTAQAVLDRWVGEYNTTRPHQSLDMDTPASRALMVGPPKSRAGDRAVGLPEALLPVLAAHLAEFVGPADDALVFTGPKGGPLRRSTFNGLVRWREATAAVGVPGLHVHDLRHTGNHLAAQVPGTTVKDLMARMGHDNERAAMIYLHRTQGADRRIADAMPVDLGDDEDPDGEDPDDEDGAAGALVPVGP